MYILYAFRHRTSQWSQTLNGIPLGAEESQDEIRVPEGGLEIPQFLKNRRKFPNLQNFWRI
jgi:hypothetical protein